MNEFIIKNGFVSKGDSIVDGAISGGTFYVTTIPSNDNSQVQVLVRNSTTGLVDYRDASTFSGAADTNTFVTGYTYNDNNTFTIFDNAGSNFPTTINQMSGLTVNGVITATTISATTFYGDGSNLTGIPHTTDTFVTGGTFSNVTDILSFTNNSGGTFNVTGITDTFVTGGTYSSGTTSLNFSGNSGFTPFTVNVSELIDDTNTFVTGFTYDNVNNLSINDNLGSSFTASINQMSGLTVSGSATITETLQVTNDGTYKFNTNPVTRLSSNGDYYGELLSIGNSGTPTVGNVYYFDSTSVWLITDANTSATSKGLIAIATSVTAFNVGMLISGYFKNTSWAFTVGDPVYLSVTSGGISTTQPTGSGDIVRVVGYAIATDEVYFNPSHDWIELV